MICLVLALSSLNQYQTFFDIIYNYSIMETPKNLNKQVKLPMLRQSSEQKLITTSNLLTLKRDNSSQNIINQSLKNILKLKNGEQTGTNGKNLLKSGGMFNRPSLTAKFEGKETLDGIKNNKLLRKASDFHHSKENFNTQTRWRDFQKEKLYQTAIQPSREPRQPPFTETNDDQLKRSLSQFYHNYLSTGVTLKTIDLQQD